MLRNLWSLLTAQGENRRKGVAFLQYCLFVYVLIHLFAAGFKWLMMELEGQFYTWTTAVYWVLMTMSTTGFGDIVFTHDVGRAYTTIVLACGIVVLIVVLPFIFFKLFYEPWLDVQVQTGVERRVPKSIRDHVLISRQGAIATGLIDRLAPSKIPYYIIETDATVANKMQADGLSVLLGEIDSQTNYRNWNVENARVVVANREDTTNTNIALTVREISQDVPVVAFVEDEDSVDVLELAGCSHVVPVKVQLGEYLANRASAGLGKTDVIGSYEELQIAEFSAHNSHLAGRKVSESHLREQTGLNIVGVWNAGRLNPAYPETVIDDKSIVVVAGLSDQMDTLDGLLTPKTQEKRPVLVIGGDAVGLAAIRSLKTKGVPVNLIDKDPDIIKKMSPFVDDAILSDANNLESLAQAGLHDATAVLLTTSDDAMNIYLAVYLRRLKPELRIVSRITHDRNLKAIHRAGADFVMSYASLGAEAVMSLLEGHELVILGEGVDLVTLKIPKSLAGKTLEESAIGSKTGLSAVGIKHQGQLIYNLHASMRLETTDELIVFGDVKQRAAFRKAFGA